MLSWHSGEKAITHAKGRELHLLVLLHVPLQSSQRITLWLKPKQKKRTLNPAICFQFNKKNMMKSGSFSSSGFKTNPTWIHKFFLIIVKKNYTAESIRTVRSTTRKSPQKFEQRRKPKRGKKSSPWRG